MARPYMLLARLFNGYWNGRKTMIVSFQIQGKSFYAADMTVYTDMTPSFEQTMDI